MRPLYEITDDLRRMLDLADETGGELDAAAAEYLATVEAEEAVKLDGYANLIRTLEMEEAAARAEAEQYQLKAAARADAVKRLKGRLLDHLTATGRTKVQTAKGRTISVQANGGKAPVKWSSVEVADLPPRFVVVRQEIDREAVREALERGEVLEFATLGEKGQHVRIR